MERRRALKLLGGGLAAVAGGKAVDNVVLGYGTVVGTNLREQDVGALVAEGLTSDLRTTDVGSTRLLLWDDVLRVKQGGEVRTTRRYPSLSRAEARALDGRYDLDGLVTDALPALRRLREDDFEVVATDYGSFFDRVRRAEAEPAAVELLRAGDTVAPGIVERFAGVDPADPEAVVEGLVDGFREHAAYDVQRYAAGSVQDNVIFGAVDLREPFREDVDFRSILASDGTGLFCYEFANRSIEALHAVRARDQTTPVFAGSVWDRRHKHVYTAIGSLVRHGEDLVVPVTFVDYTHSTLYDDFAARGIMGEGLEAYNRRHRATAIDW